MITTAEMLITPPHPLSLPSLSSVALSSVAASVSVGFSVDIRIFRGGDIAPMLIERAVSYVQIADDDLLNTRALSDIPKMPRAVIRKAITERKYLERVCRFCI